MVLFERDFGRRRVRCLWSKMFLLRGFGIVCYRGSFKVLFFSWMLWVIVHKVTKSGGDL
jgi:hypothetical protein